jgi:hypothetical protein
MFPVVGAVEVERPPNDIVGFVPPDEAIGNVPDTEATPPEEVEVAMTRPWAFTARIVPAGVPSPEIYACVVEAVADDISVVEAYAICEVEDACRPFWNHGMPVVACAVVL